VGSQPYLGPRGVSVLPRRQDDWLGVPPGGCGRSV